MFQRRHIAAAFGIALVFAALLAPVAHDLAADAHHSHATCPVCQLLAAGHDGLVPAADFPVRPDMVAAPAPFFVSNAFVPAFDYAVAHPRGPPPCFEV